MPPDDERRLHRFDFDSPRFNARLVELQPEFQAGSDEYKLDLCWRTGKSLEEVEEIVQHYSPAEIELALLERDRAAAAKSQPGITNPSKPRETRMSRLIEWEEDKDRREEALWESIGNK